jgi:hypothetical protein
VNFGLRRAAKTISASRASLVTAHRAERSGRTGGELPRDRFSACAEGVDQHRFVDQPDGERSDGAQRLVQLQIRAQTGPISTEPHRICRTPQIRAKGGTRSIKLRAFDAER